MLRQVLTIIIQANYIEEFDKIIQCRQSRIYTEITQGAYIDTNKQIVKMRGWLAIILKIHCRSND